MQYVKEDRNYFQEIKTRSKSSGIGDTGIRMIPIAISGRMTGEGNRPIHPKTPNKESEPDVAILIRNCFEIVLGKKVEKG